MSSKKKTAPEPAPTIESTMEELQTLLDRLENEDTPLQESLEAFETGIRLTRAAQKTLAEAEQKVSLLLSRNGDAVEEEIDVDGEAE